MHTCSLSTSTNNFYLPKHHGCCFHQHAITNFQSKACITSENKNYWWHKYMRKCQNVKHHKCFRHFNTFFYTISNFYFLLDTSVTHHPRITNTFVLIPPLHVHYISLHGSQSFWLCDLSQFSYIEVELHVPTLRMCPWEDQTGGIWAQITNFTQTWHTHWV